MKITIAIIAAITMASCAILPVRAGDMARGEIYYAAMRSNGVIYLDNQPNDGWILVVTHRHRPDLEKTRGATHWGAMMYRDTKDFEDYLWSRVEQSNASHSRAVFNYMYENGIHTMYPGDLLIEVGQPSKFKPEANLFLSGGREDVGHTMRLDLQADGSAIAAENYKVQDWGYIVDPKEKDGIKRNMIPVERQAIKDMAAFEQKYQSRN